MEPATKGDNCVPTLLPGLINRQKMEKIWQEVADLKAEHEKERLSNKNEQVNRRIYRCRDLKIDAPWSVGSLCEEMRKAVKKIYADKSILKTGKSADELIPDYFYIPYEKRRVTEAVEEGIRDSDAVAITRELLKGQRQGCFENTQVRATLTRITEDFVAEIRGINQGTKFTFRKYPFKLPKGGEGLELLRAYKKTVDLVDMDDFNSRAALDFLVGSNIWTFMKYNTLKECSIAGSIFCFTTWADYVGEADDAGLGPEKAYQEGMEQGLTLYDCPSLTVLADDFVMAAAFMTLKRVIRDRCLGMDSIDFEEREFDPPTPLEYMAARWWDAAYPPYMKLPLALLNAREGGIIPVDREGSPLGTRNCTAIRQVLDLGGRYNDGIDLVHDIGVEPCNEVHVAARHGGVEAVFDYGDAIAAAVDQAAGCQCGDPTHDWAVDVGMGMGMVMALYPRYRAWPQLAELYHFSTAKYVDLLNSSRHGAFVTSRTAVLTRSGTFWDEKWNPVFRMKEIPSYSGTGDCPHCELIVGWIMGRCLFQDAKDRTTALQLVQELVTEYTHEIRSVAMSGFWRKIVEIAIWGQLIGSVAEEYCEAVERAWTRVRKILEPSAEVEKIMASNVDNWIELDRLMVKSHSLTVGNVIRRAMVGVLSLQLERTDVGMYQRAVDGSIQYSLQSRGE
jgi:hypothetical protein